MIQKHTSPKGILAGLLTIILLSVSCQSTACAANCELSRPGSECHRDAGQSSDRNARSMDHCPMTGEKFDAYRITVAAGHHECEQVLDAELSTTETVTITSRPLIPANDVIATGTFRPVLFKQRFSSHLSLEPSPSEAFGSLYSILRV